MFIGNTNYTILLSPKNISDEHLIYGHFILYTIFQCFQPFIVFFWFVVSTIACLVWRYAETRRGWFVAWLFGMVGYFIVSASSSSSLSHILIYWDKFLPIYARIHIVRSSHVSFLLSQAIIWCVFSNKVNALGCIQPEKYIEPKKGCNINIGQVVFFFHFIIIIVMCNCFKVNIEYFSNFIWKM